MMQESRWKEISEEISRMLSETNTLQEGAGAILNEFGAWSSTPCILIAWEKFSVTRTFGGKRCNMIALAQRDWFLDIPLKLFYYNTENKDKAEPKVTLRMIAKDHIEPLGLAKDLTEKKLNEMYQHFLSTGEYDGNFFYNTAELVSFPEVGNLELASGQRKIVNMRIAIPSDFPQQLLAKSIGVEIIVESVPRAVDSAWAVFQILVVS